MGIFERTKNENGYWRTEKYLVRGRWPDGRGKVPILGLRWIPGRKGKRLNEWKMTLVGPRTFSEAMEQMVGGLASVKEKFGEGVWFDIRGWKRRYEVEQIGEEDWRAALEQLSVDWELEQSKRLGRLIR